MSDKHIGDAEGGFKAVSSAPDVCKVGNAVVPFDSYQSLNHIKKFATSVRARGALTLNVGSIIAGSQSNAGSGVMSGTSQGSGDCIILTGSTSVRIEGQPAAMHGSLVAMNNKNTLGTLITNEASPGNPVESNKIPCNDPPVISDLLRNLVTEKEALQQSFVSQAIVAKENAVNQADKYLDEKIDSIRSEPVEGWGWAGDAFNFYRDVRDGARRATLGLVKDTGIGLVHMSDAIPINPIQMVKNAENTLDALILLENTRLGNVCQESMSESAKEAWENTKKAVSDAMERLENKWDKGTSDKAEIVSRGILEIATILLPASKAGTVGKAGEGINAIKGARALDAVADTSKGITTLKELRAAEAAIAAKEAQVAEKSIQAITEIAKDAERALPAPGPRISPKVEAAAEKPLGTPKNTDVKAENPAPKKSDDVGGTCTAGATCKGEPVNVATGDFIQQWQVVRIPGLLPIILHRTYQSTSAASGLFGPKWTDEWSRCLRIDNDKIIFKDSDGAQFDFIAKENTVRSRNTHAPHYLLTGSKNESLTIFDSIQQHTLSFAHIDGDYRRLSAITDRNQNSIHFIYNDTHQLVEIRRNDGFLLELEYQKGQLQRIIGGKQKHEQHVFAVCAYDPQGYLSECEAYQQNHLWHRYTTDGLMVQWGDTDQTELTLTYDDKGRVITTHSSSGYWHDRFIYDDTQRMTTYIDGEGGYSRYYYNEDNLVTRVIDPLWRETHTQWKQRQKISEINSLGEKTEYGYHFDGQLAYLFLPDGRHVYYDYNELGQLISYTSPSGEKWLLDYDTQGNLTTLTDPQGHIQAYEYSQHGELLKAIHPNGAQWQYEYNSTHQLIKTKNPYQNSTEYQFDELGRLQEYTDALKHTTRYHYSQEHASENGSVSDILLPDGVHQHIEYDSERRVVAVTDGEGKITRYRYGPFDLLLAMVRPDGTEVRFEYDSLTRLKAVINATGDKYTYERDRAGQIIRETDFTGRVQEHRYDQLGRRIATRYPDQHELRWRYDVSGLVVEQSEWLDNGVENKCLSTTTYEYNARLQLVKATNPDSVVEFEYDAQGRLTCERINGQEIKHDWDSDHSTLTRTTFGDRELHYAFGQLGELTSLQINQHAPLEFGYNAVGQEYLRRSEAGFVNSSHYTATGLLAHQRAGRGSENFLQSLQQDPQQPPFCTDVHRSYQYDRAHNVVRIEDDRWKQTTYRYNANDQITETQYSNQIGNRDEKFLYDANLNLTEHMTLPSDAKGAMLQLFQQQQAGRVTRRDTARGYQLYHYDVNGRLEKKVVYEHGYRPKEWRYLWNTQNQLTACFTPKGDCWRYTYDAFGRRLSKTQTVDSQAAHINPLFPQLKPKVTAWHYLWSGDQMVEETPIYADGTIAYDSQVQWLYEPGAITPTARYQNGKLHYVVTDHQGTPREIFTEAGKASWAGRLNTWGQMQFWQSRDGLADNDPTYTECHFRFAGQYEDRETGLYYNRFRYYDKDSGQYISPDPIGLLGGFNPYGYVHCPTGWVDPFGLAKEPIIFLPDGGDVLHPKTVSAQNPEGLFTIKATGSYADDKLALYKAAGIDEYPSRKWISHHVSYNPATNEMTMQLVNPEYHSHPHVGGAHQFEEKTGHKYGTQDAIDEATKRNSAILNCKPGGIKR
ncbi:RHS repeat-associated core domain-containing protein [Providencia rettgeri]